MRAKLHRSKAFVALTVLLCTPLAGCPGDPEDPLEHGIINVEFRRGQSETSSPYTGTSRVEITLVYRECLTEFYRVNSDFKILGSEGELVFGPLEDGGEGWFDRLCEDRPGQVSCTVDEPEGFKQELDSAKQLTVNYLVDGEVEDRTLPFGPLPLASLADCEPGNDPIVRLVNAAAVRGLDGNGDVVWSTESFDPAEAATGQGAPITVRAARP